MMRSAKVFGRCEFGRARAIRRVAAFASKWLPGLGLGAILAGVVGCASSTPPSTTVATPVISPAQGTYSSTLSVAIADATIGAAIHYTLDGSAPTAASPTYTSPLTVSANTTVNAMAVENGYANSAVSSSQFVFAPVTAAPTISPTAGTYTAAQTVTLADATAGAAIYYTLDGSAPTTASPQYTAPITVGSTTTINAIALAPNDSVSGGATATFTIVLSTVATPVITPGTGSYPTSASVNISDATPNATIYYTLDGSTPTIKSSVYSGAIPVSTTETVTAIATAAGYLTSSSTRATLTITAAEPTFSVTPGNYKTTQTVAISDATPNAAIYYTTDGSTPSQTSTPYTAPIAVSGTETVNAIAYATNLSASPIASAFYTLSPIPAPTFTIGGTSTLGGSFPGAQTLTINSATSGASIYYTVDGTPPNTTTSAKYSGPITISQSETINAIAGGGNFVESADAYAQFDILQSSLSGVVTAGGQPVSGATVQLYAAGNSGYASPATALDPLSVTTDSMGKFTVNFNCPAPSTQTYLVAGGGNPGLAAGTNNASLALMSGLGNCAGLSSLSAVTVNEATTVASVTALAPFMTSAANLGASSTNSLGLANAFLTIPNLVNLTSGATLAMTPATSVVSNAGNFLSGTVPQAEIDTLANLLAGCAATDGTGTGCASLLSNAQPTGGATPADTLTAALDIARNPGNNVASLYGLASPTGPFQPSLSAAPNDWTIGVQYEWTINTNTPLPGTNSQAIDASGNVWVADLYEHGLIEITPTGSFPPNGSAGYPGEGGSLSSPAGTAIDPSTGDIWIGATNTNGVGALFSFAPSGDQIAPTDGYIGSTLNQPSLLAFDGLGGLWVLDSGQVLKFHAADGTPVAVPNSNPPAYTYTAGGITAPITLVLDAEGNVWVTDQTAGLVKLSNDGSSGTAYSIGAQYPDAMAIDASGNLWIGDGGGRGGVVEVNSQGTVLSPASEFTGAGLATPNYLAIDGAGHVWAANTGGGNLETISELDSAGNAISPATGYLPPPGAYNTYGGLSIDASGNLWVLNPNYGPIQMVGLAAPTLTPLAANLVPPNRPAQPAAKAPCTTAW